MKLKTSILIDHFEMLFVLKLSVFFIKTSYTSEKRKFISQQDNEIHYFQCFLRKSALFYISGKMFSKHFIIVLHIQCFLSCGFFSTEVIFQNGFQRTTCTARPMYAITIITVDTSYSWRDIQAYKILLLLKLR